MFKKINNLFLFIVPLIAKNVPIEEIYLEGLITNPKQEISGMDWYNDNLILLPENLNGYVFAIKKSELDSRINGNDTTTIFPEQIKFNTPNYKELVPGFDSFEAIAFRGYEVYLTIEIRFADSHTLSQRNELKIIFNYL